MSMKAWDGAFEIPCPGRSTKPRQTGLTMVIDKGLGDHLLRDMLVTAGDYIDIIKLTFGTSAFYDRDVLKKKNEFITAAGT
ncbi:MAG: phosphosulfolactate synthase, partial [Candidatus Aminicenantes bacterium]|nr:phosphosulfolactate synthase [Candidatus Aminicenantes bacterium]